MRLGLVASCLGLLLPSLASAAADQAGHATSGRSCFDELGHAIPGACDDDATPTDEAAPATKRHTRGDEAVADDTEENEDEGDSRRTGFFLRLSLGGGRTRHETMGGGGIGSSEPFPGTKSMQGGSATVEVEIGGAPMENFAVYGLMWGNAISAPRIHAASGRIATNEDTGLSISGYGAGVSYYLNDYVYLDGALGIAHTSMNRNEKQADGSFQTTRTEIGSIGPLLVLGFGIEKKISESWALGGSLKAFAASITDQHDKRLDWAVRGGALQFSATFF